MEKNVITAQKDTSIFDLVDMFVENNVNAIPIVQDDKGNHRHRHRRRPLV